jgi:hypothetical protein
MKKTEFADFLDSAENGLISIDECANRMCSVLHFADHAEKRTQRDSLFLALQDKFCLLPSVAARNATKVLIRVLILEDQTVFIERLLGNLNWRESRARQLWAATIYPELTNCVENSESLEVGTLTMLLEHCKPLVHPRTSSDMEGIFTPELVKSARALHDATLAAMDRCQERN